jgi:hypothetical protein
LRCSRVAVGAQPKKARQLTTESGHVAAFFFCGDVVNAPMRFFCLLAVLLGSACQHVEHHIPALDLRSDGKSAAIATTPVTEPPRTGVDSWTKGVGILTVDPKTGAFVLEDRRVFVIGLFPILDQEQTEELAKAAPAGVAARNVVIKHEITAVEGVVSACIRFVPIVSILGLIMPTFTVTMTGDRVIEGRGAVAPQTLVAPPSPSPLPPTTPAPLAPAAPVPSTGAY